MIAVYKCIRGKQQGGKKAIHIEGQHWHKTNRYKPATIMLEITKGFSNHQSSEILPSRDREEQNHSDFNSGAWCVYEWD